MTKKGTTRYQIDEFHIASGIAGFNNDIRYQGDHINLELTNLSSEQGTKTSIKGSTSYAGGNVIKINGWAYLRDEPKKFNISVSSRGLNLLAFREIFNRYRIDTKNTDIAINITAKSDAMEGIILSSHIQIKKTGLPSFKKKMADIRLDADVFYCIVDNSLTIHNFTARSGDVYAVHLKGVIKEIQKNPSYEAEIKIDGLELSALDIMKGVKAGGIITSDTIHVKGKFDKAMPEISGSVLLAGAFFRSNTADMKQINAKMAFSSGKEISATAEASAKILKARGYTLRTPSDVSISINTRGTPEKIAMTSSITLSPVDLSLKTGKDGYLESLHLEIDGTLKEKSFSGKASLEAKRLQYADYALKRIKGNIGINYRRNIVRDASLHAQVVFGRKDLEFTAEAATGTISAAISGFVKGFLKKERAFSIQVSLPETNIADIRTSFWDIFPDSLLYGVLDGSISSGITFGYREGRFTANGKFRLKDFMIGGEYGEYSAGPINGVIPFVYGEVNKKHEPIRLPSFERSEFGNVSRYYSAEFKETGYNKIVIGSFHYGFRLLKDIKIWMKQDGNILNVGRFSANIFGGKLNGSAVIDMTDRLNYKAGILLEGLSLKQLCDDIEPIRGYISGKVDGTGTLKGSGIGLLQIIGMGDLWTYSTQDEKTKISKEFLQKIGGPSVKAYLGDRPFNKGIMSLYLQKGYVIFRELEISNRNFFGIQDLSVKVAPLSNRIAIDHLMWTIVEAAQRAKRNKP